MLLNTLLLLSVISLSSFNANAAYSRDGTNVLYYWGQNSAGGKDTQSSLATYCQSGLVDGVLLSFLHIFNNGGLPGLNFANACETYFNGTVLLQCPHIGEDIKVCQSLGVKVILSLGGAAGSYGFSDDSDAIIFSNTIWNLFGGGSAPKRPFGDAQIDGIDLDIEGGTSTGYSTFVNAIRAKFPPDFLVGAAPQCPFPDVILGPVIDVTSLDYINVQFYNNYCSVSGNSFNFDTWANWATNTSPNKNVKIYLTLPASSTAAGSGYVPTSIIGPTTLKLASQHQSTFGGISIWDISQAWNNGDFASQIYSIVKGGRTDIPTSNIPSDILTTIVPSSTSYFTTAYPTSTLDPVSTASSADISAASTLDDCVSNGQICSTEGQYICTSSGSYAICNYSKWIISPCPPGSYCMYTTDGLSVYCGFSAGPNKCPFLGTTRVISSVVNKSGSYPEPYVSSETSVQFSVSNILNSEFGAILNARRTIDMPFKNTVVFKFIAPANVKFTRTAYGIVNQTSNSVVIKAKNNYNKSMMVIVKVKGILKSGVFVAPNPITLFVE